MVREGIRICQQPRKVDGQPKATDDIPADDPSRMGKRTSTGLRPTTGFDPERTFLLRNGIYKIDIQLNLSSRSFLEIPVAY
jgi:hypothetical protein